MPPNDHDLRARLLAGDPDAAQAFLEVYGPAITAALSVTLVRAGRRADVEEVFQAFFLHLLERNWAPIGAWRGEAGLRTYGASIARNFCIDWLRRRLRSERWEQPPTTREDDSNPVSPPEEPVAADPSPQDQMAARELRETFTRTLQQLPAGPRQILVLRYVHDLDIAEIAERLDITRNSADQRLHRARAALRRALDEAGVARHGHFDD